MLGRILRSADFERVLAAPPRARSAHFALHHLAARPSVPAKPLRQAALTKLSTGDAPSCPPVVDDLPAEGVVAVGGQPAKGPDERAPDCCWLGTVVPKRHAKRAVTRNLIKRQMRALMADQAGQLPPGLWVLRLKAPFDRQKFVSAASAALRVSARDELGTLLARAAARR